MANYEDTNKKFEEINKEVEELKSVTENNIKVYLSYTKEDLEKLTKQTEHTILNIIYLEQVIKELNDRNTKTNKQIASSRIKDAKNKDFLERLDYNEPGYILTSALVPLVVSLLFGHGIWASLLISALVTFLYLPVSNLIKEVKSREVDKIKIYEREVAIVDNAIKLLTKIKELHLEEYNVQLAKMKELQEEDTTHESVDKWAREVYNENQSKPKRKILRKVDENARYFD